MSSASKKLKLFTGSRKAARATASIVPGVGRVRINEFLLESLNNELSRETIMAPLRLARVEPKMKKVHYGGRFAS